MYCERFTAVTFVSADFLFQTANIKRAIPDACTRQPSRSYPFPGRTGKGGKGLTTSSFIVPSLDCYLASLGDPTHRYYTGISLARAHARAAATICCLAWLP